MIESKLLPRAFRIRVTGWPYRRASASSSAEDVGRGSGYVLGFRDALSAALP